jgi:hypothetical protein
MTSSSDGHSHLITAQAFAAGVRAGHGRYLAACGTDVIAVSLMSGPGPRCHLCTGGTVPHFPGEADDPPGHLSPALA